MKNLPRDLTERCDAVPQGERTRITLEIGTGPVAVSNSVLSHTNGAWIFDTIAGEEEIINRHIGRDDTMRLAFAALMSRRSANTPAGLPAAPGRQDTLRDSRALPERRTVCIGLRGQAARPVLYRHSFAEATLEGYNWNRGTEARVHFTDIVLRF